MRTLGLIGGMSWESTVPYYQAINERVRDRLGGLHSAELVMWSVDFQPIERLQVAGAWDDAGARLAQIATRLEHAGAEAIVLCTNTMHRVDRALEEAVAVPLLHIADVTARAVTAAGVRRVALLGTRFTMEQGFLVDRLASHGLDVTVPETRDRADVHRIIYDELCVGVVREESRARYQEVMSRLADEGAEAIILGCTEITLLVDQSDAVVPLFDSTALHATYAADWAMQDDLRDELR
jgi:aspartate racemase